MVRLRLLALVVFLSNVSFAQQLQYTRTVKGNLFLPPGQGAQNSKIRFQLKYCAGQVGRVPINPGNPPGPTGLVVSFEPFDVNVQSDGTWQTQIYGNDQILCGTDTTGPSRWLVQPVFNGAANAGVEFQIQSCGPIANCAPFLPDSAPRCSLTVTTNCALEGGTVDQPDTTVTVNAQMAIPNAINFGNQLLPPANGMVINFLLNGNQAGAYLPGNGNASTCLSGTGTWVLCGGGGGGGGGVTGATPNRGLVLSGTTLGLITCSTNQYLSWNGSAWVCTTLTGGGGGGTLPTTPQYDLFASTGSGGAQASGLLGGSGFMKGQVFLATGDVTSAPAPFPLAPNASVEYFPTGASFGGINLGAAHGLAAYFSHSGQSAAGPGYGNGGLMLGGGNSSGTNYQVYLDCESAPALGCDFKVPVTQNGAAIGGGGGGGSLPTIAQWNLFASTGSGGAADSGVAAETGFLRAQVLESIGAVGSAPGGFTPPNGSIEYFPSGGYGIGGANGLAIHFSHSSISNGVSPGWGNGGIAFGGGNASGSNYQIYLDCESAPLGCDFKVPVTYNGAAIGGGGSGSGTVSTGTVNQFAYYTGPTSVSSNPHLDDGLTQAGTITSTEPVGVQSLLLNGSVGSGASMTSAGGTLPTPSGTTGGIGIGPGGVPSMSVSGGAWIPIPTTAGSSNATAVSINGTAAGSALNIADSSLLHWTLSGGTGSASITGTGSSGDCLLGTATFGPCPGSANPWQSAGVALTTPGAGIGGFGISTGGVPMASANGGAWFRVLQMYINSVTPNSSIGINFGPNPTAPANGKLVTFQMTPGSSSSPATASAFLPGDGSLNCLSGQGTYVTCGGAGGGGTTVSINGTSAGTVLNITNTAATPPANGAAITWTAPTGGATSGYLVGSGNATDCLLGTGAFGICPTSGGSGTVGTGVANEFAVYNGTNSIIGSTVLTSTGSVIASTQPLSMSTTISGCATPAFGNSYGGGITPQGTNIATSFLSICAGQGERGRVTASQLALNPLNFTIGWGSLTSPSISLQGITGTPSSLLLNATTLPATLAIAGTGGNATLTAPTAAGGLLVSSNPISMPPLATLPTPAAGNGGFAVDASGAANIWNPGTSSWVPIPTSATGSVTTIYTCTIAANVNFTTTSATICQQPLGTSPRQWLVHCNIPWNFTAGTGTSNVVIGINLTATPSYQTYLLPVMWNATGPSNMGAVSITASGQTPVVTANSLTVSVGGTIYSVMIDGTIAAAANTTFSVYGTSSVGTGSFRPGVACELK